MFMEWKTKGAKKPKQEKTGEKAEVKKETAKAARPKGREAKKPGKEVAKEEKAEKPGIKREAEFDPWSVLQHPHLAEKSMKAVELENKLVFIVDRKATKDLIALAVEKEFNVTVVGVNTEITQKGLKKAYVKLSGQYSASDIATRLGMV